MRASNPNLNATVAPAEALNMDDSDTIFKEKGRPVKFFIQKDLTQNVIDELTLQVTANGGSVEDKVPLQGFVIVEPTSGEGKRLYACWSTADRPFRCFVPPSFVSACLQARKLLPQPFRDRSRGERKRMHIHSSITDKSFAEAICARIWNSGGDPTAAELEADVIIAEEKNPAFRDLIMRYDHTRHQFVETPAWVTECVESGVYRNTPSVKKNLGGRLKGSRRTEFTEVDDNHLARYIASRLPDPTMRGRTGNKMYQDLCSRVDLYPWAERHPWQSWRERYKNNVQRFTHLIDSFLELQPSSPDGKGLHGFVRAQRPLLAKNSPNSRKSASDDGPIEEKAPIDPEWGGSQWEIREGRSNPPSWGKGKRKAEDREDVPEKRRRICAESGDAKGLTTVTQNAVPKKGDSLTPRHSFDAAETGEAIDAQALVEVSDSPPLTDNRSPNGNLEVAEASFAAVSPTQRDSDDTGIGEETQMLLTAHQQMLTGTRSSRRSLNSRVDTEDSTKLLIPEDQLLNFQTNTTTNIALKDPRDEDTLVHIACRYRFVLDEVKEIYEEQKCNLERTKAFFKEARQDLAEKRAMWKLVVGPVTRETERSN